MTTTSIAPVVSGPALLPLRYAGGETPFELWHFDFGGDRWAAVWTGDLHDGPVPLRIESACLFGHVLRSAQCDCGFQLEAAMTSFTRRGRGLLLYAIDQDARGLGIASHFAIYAMRQQEKLDTEAVYARLDAPVDARSYEAALAILRHLDVHAVRLLSNNPRRDRFLREAGLTVTNEPLAEPLNVHNMSTLMLEKEDLGYDWSFETHADWLAPMQAAVAGHQDHGLATVAVPGSGNTDHPLAAAEDSGHWELAAALLAARPPSVPPGQPAVVYLTDLPRADELRDYATLGAYAVVVPFADLPPLLHEAARTAGIRIVDWARRNAYPKPRPQWTLVVDAEGRQVYTRGNRIRVVATPSGLAAVRASELSCAVTVVWPRWLELDPGAAALTTDAVLAVLSGLGAA
jgi:GTP cyclohydrolase II